jgi:hypothetical protein
MRDEGQLMTTGCGEATLQSYRRLKVLPAALALRDAVREVKTLLRMAKPLFRRGGALLTMSIPANLEVVRFTVPNSARLSDQDAFTRWLVGPKEPPQGVDSLYLSPTAWAASPLAQVAHSFPPASGLKISKNVGDIGSPYMTWRSGRRLQRRLSGAHYSQAKTYDYLNKLGYGPALFSIMEIVDGSGAIRVGYVVEHVEGSTPSVEEFAELVARLRRLCNDDKAALVSGSGWAGKDFQLPDGNGNAIKSSKDGKTRYIDVHSFRVLDPNVLVDAEHLAIRR